MHRYDYSPKQDQGETLSVTFERSLRSENARNEHRRRNAECYRITELEQPDETWSYAGGLLPVSVPHGPSQVPEKLVA